jgi:hypothetical protein
MDAQTAQSAAQDGFGALTQIGVGGIFCILTLREVFGYLRYRSRHNGAAGDKSTEYWRIEMRQAMAETFTAQMLPVLSNQNGILRDIRDAQEKANEGIAELVTLTRDRRSENR